MRSHVTAVLRELGARDRAHVVSLVRPIAWLHLPDAGPALRGRLSILPAAAGLPAGRGTCVPARRPARAATEGRSPFPRGPAPGAPPGCCTGH